MRILHRILEGCERCPFSMFTNVDEFGKLQIGLACRRKGYAVAEDDIPDWCPLPGAKAYPQCHLDICKDRKGSALYCKDRECEARFIHVSYEDSIGEWLK